MQYYTEPISRLIEEFSKLPGIGKKTAQRLAFHVINMNNNDVEALSKAILDAKKEIKYCSICCNITDKDPCSMCSNPNRDSSVICVVEDPRDVAAMEFYQVGATGGKQQKADSAQHKVQDQQFSIKMLFHESFTSNL